jgi:hypothetical protein
LGKSEQQIEYLENLIRLLDDSSTSLIDFDELTDRLSELKTALREHQASTNELEVLRQDIGQRMAGMVKAIAAVDRKGDNWEEALAVVEGLRALSAEELLKQYRRISARFRDFFPAHARLASLPARNQGRCGPPAGHAETNAD